LKAKFEARGASRRALNLIKSYLHKRFLRVVSREAASTAREIFSGVPQGGKWSPSLWNFDVCDIDLAIDDDGDLFCYADDNSIWFEVTEENRPFILQAINTNLARLSNWASDNKTTFEPAKSYAQVFSRKWNPIDPYGMLFLGDHELEVVTTQKVVGYTLDSKLNWGEMIDSLAVKARKRLAALVRLRPLLDDRNMKTMYTMFIRSILEYGSIAYMGAAQSHLSKLDRIQESAQRIGNFSVPSLGSRREAAALAFALKLLDGKAKGVLSQFIPVVSEVPASDAVSGATRGRLSGYQMLGHTGQVKCKRTLDNYARGFWGKLPEIWSKIPQDLINTGRKTGWLKIKSKCTKFLLFGQAPCSKPKLKSKLKINAQPFVPKNIDMKLYKQYMSNKDDGILII
jgi:hypothetical protein